MEEPRHHQRQQLEELEEMNPLGLRPALPTPMSSLYIKFGQSRFWPRLTP